MTDEQIETRIREIAENIYEHGATDTFVAALLSLFREAREGDDWGRFKELQAHIRGLERGHPVRVALGLWVWGSVGGPVDGLTEVTPTILRDAIEAEEDAL